MTSVFPVLNETESGKHSMYEYDLLVLPLITDCSLWSISLCNMSAANQKKKKSSGRQLSVYEVPLLPFYELKICFLRS